LFVIVNTIFSIFCSLWKTWSEKVNARINSSHCNKSFTMS